jgi:hypothetical protein
MVSTSLLKPLAAGLGSLFFISNISLLELISIVWFIFGGFRLIGKAFGLHCCRIGLVFVSSLTLLVSGLVNDSPPDTIIKGVGAYFLLPTTVLFLTKIFTYRELWVVFVTNQVAAILLPSLADSPEVEAFSQSSFKFGYSGVLTSLILTVCSFIPSIFPIRKSRVFSHLVPACAISALALWGNLRLLFLNSMLSYVLVLISRRRFWKLPKLSTPHNSVLTVMIAVGFPLFLVFYSIALSQLSILGLSALELLPSGLVSSDAINKTQAQMSGDLGLLFGGRTEIFSSILAWQEKPIIGWGPWALDPGNYFRLAGREMMENTFHYTTELDKLLASFEAGFQGLIPTHSALLNLLVWGGLIAVVPFYSFFSIYLRRFISFSVLSGLNLPYYVAFVFVGSVWTILFSPMGFSNRILLILLISLSLSYTNFGVGREVTPHRGVDVRSAERT